MNENSYCSAFSLAFDIVSVLDLYQSNRSVVLSCFNLHFLMPCDVEHLFICLFVICVSSLVRCLLRSLAHFNQFGYFLIVEF